ncbi:hypothetical protein [Helicobacter fennelliae]|uniref:hypothetical protein n=1 Tax=Helicobacter fennelliae TaxID=215 RepID=UPI00130DD9A9|nr:hypothetical protein [Helicobacter fennelliae]
MTSLHSRHCEDNRTKQSSKNRLPRLPSGSLAMTIFSGFFVRFTRSSNDEILCQTQTSV